VIVGVIRRKPVLTHASIVCEGMLASVNSVNSVPRDSVLGPLLYLLYTAELEQLIFRHGLHIYQYANDSQVYIRLSVGDVRVAAHNFTVCVHEVNDWMRASRLRVNPTKTQVVWLGSSQQLKHVDIHDIPVLSITVPVVESARDLGVILDSRLTLSALCRAGYYQLHSFIHICLLRKRQRYLISLKKATKRNFT